MRHDQAGAKAGDARQRARLLRWTGRWMLALLLVAAAAAAGYRLALDSGLKRLQESAGHRLDVLATRLDGDLARFDYLPALLETSPLVPSLLQAPSDARLRDAVNQYLETVNATAGAEMLYVLDPAGLSVAASDSGKPGTTIGQDLAFRPYVREAIDRGKGQFYGIGVTSLKPGYYLSYALHRDSRLLGLTVVKVAIDAAEDAWRAWPGDILLVDELGVVILSTRPDLKYRPTVPLGATQRAEVLRSRRYGESDLSPLSGLAEEGSASQSMRRIEFEGRTRLATHRALRTAPWRMVALDEAAPVEQQAAGAAVIAALAMAVLLLSLTVLWLRRRAIRARLASRAALQAAHDSLESVVMARTAQLREAQGELIHASKMAAIGQMSAGVAHELNQPLTALRALSDNARVLLEQGSVREVGENLTRIAGTVDRLSRLTSQLKTFAHKGYQAAVAVALAPAISDALAAIADEIRQHDVRVVVEVEPPGLAVSFDEPALVSVIVNLARNAIDAMAGAPVRQLRIRAGPDAARVRVSVTDTGPGIRADVLPRLFEPFVSTKRAGNGLGLGLVIAAQLLRPFGGSLSGTNLEEGGACFEFELAMPATNVEAVVS